MKKAGEIGEVKVYSFAKIHDAIVDLASGQIQAVMKVYPVAAWFQQNTPGLRILEQVPNDPQPLGIGFDQANPDLVAAVNAALAKIKHDGTYQRLTTRWHVG